MGLKFDEVSYFLTLWLQHYIITCEVLHVEPLSQIAQVPYSPGQHRWPGLVPVSLGVETLCEHAGIRCQQGVPGVQVHDAVGEVVVVPPAPGGGQDVGGDVGERPQEQEVEVGVPTAVLERNCF